MFMSRSLSLQVLGTPGHTGGSVSLVVRDRKSGEAPCRLFPGDTLFAGDINRTDFFGNARKEEMAGRIYDGFTQKILPHGGMTTGNQAGFRIGHRPFFLLVFPSIEKIYGAMVMNGV
jgi:glyoxylase-like metal-dependent hydrolase (beta-lactamase superfamily II)